MIYEFRGLHSGSLLVAYMQFQSNFNLDDRRITNDIAKASADFIPNYDIAICDINMSPTDGLTTFTIAQRVAGKVVGSSITGYTRLKK